VSANSALSGLACELAQKLQPGAAGAEVLVVELKADAELRNPLALRERVREVVAGALLAAQPKPTPAASPSKKSYGGRAKLRVELSLEVKGSKLRVSADLRRGSGLWQRVRRTGRPLELHAYAERTLDPELRALIPPPPLVVSEVIKVPAPERGTLALACGDLGLDGAQELAVVSRSNIRVGRIVQGRFHELAAAAWAALSPVAPAPLREPIGAVEISEQGRLRVWLSDRQDGLELDAALVPVQRFPSLLPVPGGGCTARAGLGVSGTITRCVAGDAAIAPDLGGVLDAVAGSAVLRVGRELGESRLRMRRGNETPTTGARVGAQLAVGDADHDGESELAFAADTLEKQRDQVSLVTLAGGQLKKRFELAARAVSAIAICAEREGRGMAPIVVASGDELWVIR